ncbi:hypothetical protein PspLS_01600 [Pyricularia sp. CBS 133598]|nr:hypothetical protein PspLS_01600 [Pyricularia sp. CBS 133598]
MSDSLFWRSYISRTPSSILIFGATGKIGLHLTEWILKASPRFSRVSIFTTPSTAAAKGELLSKWETAGASIIVGDLTNPQDVADAYRGVDTVVSAVGRNVLEKQIQLIRLAEESSSVQWFFPSEYGTDIEHGPKSAGERPHQDKLAVRKFIRDEIRRLHVVYLVTGPFFEMWAKFLHDQSRKEAQIIDVITCKKSSIWAVGVAIRSILGGSASTAAKTTDCIPMTEAAFATISSIFTLGGLVGALASGPLCSRQGRRLAMQYTAVAFLIASVVESVANSVFVMALGRLINGLGAGAATVIVPLYISEVAPPGKRGFFGAFTQIGTNIGILSTQTLGYFLSHGSSWRWIMGAGAIVAGSHTAGLFFVPESPPWLAAHKGEVNKARDTLQRIRGKGANIEEEVATWGSHTDDDDVIVNETQGLLATSADAETALPSPRAVKSSPPVHMGFVQVIRDPFYRPAIVSVVGIMVSQQICGINSIIMYSVSLLDGMLPVNSALITIFISIINLFTTVACSPLPDRLGRKTCILLSIAGQGGSSLGLALSILFGAKTLSAVFVLLFVASFAVGLGPVPFIMASELVGQEAVGAVQSWSLAANYVATFLVAQFFPIINTALNQAFGGAGYAFFMFAAFAAMCFAFISVYVPETLGKKDADEVWGRTATDRRMD